MAALTTLRDEIEVTAQQDDKQLSDTAVASDDDHFDKDPESDA